VVGKECYPKYCIKCPFLVKAEWSPKEGFKHGWLDIYCCANGGKWVDDGQPICPHGVGYGLRLGTAFEFDPKGWYPLHELEEMYKFDWTNIDRKENEIGMKTHD
jgi:hypothetical protein